MYWVLVKIHYYRCLYVLFQNALNSLIKRLTSLVTQKGLKLRFQRDGYLMFGLDPRRDQADKILLETTAIVEEALISCQEWLNGYTILLERMADASLIEDLFYRLREVVYRTDVVNNVWLGPSLCEEKHREWGLVSHRGPVQLKRSFLTQHGQESFRSPFLEHPIYAILEANLVHKKKVKGPTLLIHNDLRLLKLFVFYTLRDVDHVYHLRSPKSYEEPLSHMAACLNRLWGSGVRAIDEFCGDDWSSNGKELLREALEQRKVTVAYLVFENFSRWPEVFHRFWEGALRSAAKHVRPVFLEETLPELKGLGDPLDLQGQDLQKIWGGEDEDRLLSHLDPLQRKILFLLDLGRQTLSYPTLKSFLVGQGEDEGLVEDKVGSLERKCLLVRCGDRLHLLEQDHTRLDRLLYEDLEETKRRLFQHILSAEETLSLTQRLDLCLRARFTREVLDLTRAYCRNLIYRGNAFFNRVLRDPQIVGLFQDDPTSRAYWSTMAATMKLRFALDRSDRTYSPSLIEAYRRKHLSSEVAEKDAEWVCHSGRLLFATGRQEEAYQRIRQAYVSAQSHKDRDTEIHSAMEIGKILLKRRKTDEAGEYFSIAWKDAENYRKDLLAVHAAILTGVARFLVGNLFGCSQAWSKAQEAALKGRFHRTHGVSSFLLGRHAFEIGQYTTAAKYFEIAAEAYGKSAKLWAVRCLTYNEDSETARKLLERLPLDAEGELFLAEALFFSGKIQEALNLVRKWDQAPASRVKWLGLRWDTSTGFSSLEDLLLDDDLSEPVLQRYRLAFRDYLVASFGQTGREEALQRLEKVCTDKNLWQRDPNAHVYLLWLSLGLGKDQAVKDARWSTFMGRALKELQARGSKVDNRDERVTYLNVPYWNSLLLSEAKKNKLL